MGKILVIILILACALTLANVAANAQTLTVGNFSYIEVDKPSMPHISFLHILSLLNQFEKDNRHLRVISYSTRTCHGGGHWRYTCGIWVTHEPSMK